MSGADPRVPESTDATAQLASEGGYVALSTSVNGGEWRGMVPTTQSLLDFIRDTLGLTGTKRGCEWMVCGACTVLVDGEPTYSCNMLAADADARELLTIEGVSQDGNASALQAALVRNVGIQCGYCTPGQVMSAQAFLTSHEEWDERAARTWMRGNICRCGSYAGILAAMREVFECPSRRSTTAVDT